jgi:hypothetical protein
MNRMIANSVNILDLSNNDLTSIDISIVNDFPQLKRMYLYNNPRLCENFCRSNVVEVLSDVVIDTDCECYKYEDGHVTNTQAIDLTTETDTTTTAEGDFTSSVRTFTSTKSQTKSTVRTRTSTKTRISPTQKRKLPPKIDVATDGYATDGYESTTETTAEILFTNENYPYYDDLESEKYDGRLIFIVILTVISALLFVIIMFSLYCCGACIRNCRNCCTKLKIKTYKSKCCKCCKKEKPKPIPTNADMNQLSAGFLNMAIQDSPTRGSTNNEFESISLHNIDPFPPVAHSVFGRFLRRRTPSEKSHPV